MFVLGLLINSQSELKDVFLMDNCKIYLKLGVCILRCTEYTSKDFDGAATTWGKAIRLRKHFAS